MITTSSSSIFLAFPLPSFSASSFLFFFCFFFFFFFFFGSSFSAHSSYIGNAFSSPSTGKGHFLVACIAASLNTASSTNAFCKPKLVSLFSFFFFFSPPSPSPPPSSSSPPRLLPPTIPNDSSLNFLTILRNEFNQFTLSSKTHRRSNLAFACNSLSYTSSSYSSVFIVSNGSRLYLLQVIVLLVVVPKLFSCTFFHATPNTMRLMTSFENFAQSSRVLLSAFAFSSSSSSSSSPEHSLRKSSSSSFSSSGSSSFEFIIHARPGIAINTRPGIASFSSSSSSCSQM